MVSDIKFVFIVNIVFLIGCTYKPFQPIPEPWEQWRKTNSTVIDVRRAMLECGWDLLDPPESNNAAALVYRCMEKDGFELFRESRYDPTCTNYPEMPACQLPKEEVPNRDPAHRLNSKFCKKHHAALICQP